MNKLELIPKFLRLVFSDTSMLLKSLANYTIDAHYRTYYKSKYQKPLKFVDLKDLSPSLSEHIENYTFLDGTSRITDIALIMNICRRYENCDYLEIGSFRGESLYNVSTIARNCVSVSLSKNELLNLGVSKSSVEYQRFFTQNRKNIKHVEHNSLTFDFNSLNQKFDVIFIDADHTYPAVKKDTENAFKLLKNENSVIIWHDAGRGYEKHRFEVEAGILDGAPANAHPYIYRVTNTLCAIYTKEKIKAKELPSPQVPTKTFNVDIRLKPLE
jgi:hypothetical protein